MLMEVRFVCVVCVFFCVYSFWIFVKIKLEIRFEVLE